MEYRDVPIRPHGSRTDILLVSCSSTRLTLRTGGGRWALALVTRSRPGHDHEAILGDGPLVSSAYLPAAGGARAGALAPWWGCDDDRPSPCVVRRVEWRNKGFLWYTTSKPSGLTHASTRVPDEDVPRLARLGVRFSAFCRACRDVASRVRSPPCNVTRDCDSLALWPRCDRIFVSPFSANDELPPSRRLRRGRPRVGRADRRTPG